MTEGNNYLNTRQAADYLGLAAKTLARYRIEGSGPVFHRFGTCVRYLRTDLDAWRPWAGAPRPRTTAACSRERPDEGLGSARQYRWRRDCLRRRNGGSGGRRGRRGHGVGGVGYGIRLCPDLPMEHERTTAALALGRAVGTPSEKVDSEVKRPMQHQASS